MNFPRHITKWISYLSIFTLLTMQLAPLQAAMVSSESLLKQAQHDLSIAQMTSLLDREEIQAQLTSMGIDPVAAKARVNQMNAAELAELNHRLDELPAGGDVLGVLLTVFIVLVITDMLGATDVFPFVKNINK